MSFKLAEPTGVLVLTEISSQYRLLRKIFKYHDIQEEEEAEQGHVQASTMDTEHSTSPSLHVCCHLDEGVVPSLLNPANVAASVTQRHRRGISLTRSFIRAITSYTPLTSYHVSWIPGISYPPLELSFDDLGTELGILY